MKVIAKVSSTEVLVSCSLTELGRIVGIGDGGYISNSECEKLSVVGTTIGIADSFDAFKQVSSAPDRIAQIAKTLRDEADRIDVMNTKYGRLITPPVKAARA